MSKRLMALLAAAAALVVLAGGCGSSSDETSVEKPLTKAQYVKQGSKICAKQGEVLGKEMISYGETHNLDGGGTKKETELTITAVLIPGFRAEVEGLEELTPPKADEKQIEAMLLKFNTGLEEGARDPQRFFTTSEFMKGTKASESYGLKGCGTLFLSSASG